jgi:predicted enzyme related to lactoylglutathione lyase
LEPGTSFAITLWATDVYALADFLQAVAGAEMRQRHPGFASLSVGGIDIQVHDDESYRGHPWYQALAKEGVARGIGAELRIRVDDVQASYREALKRGAQAIAAPYQFENAVECQLLGPDGYVLSLWQVSEYPKRD